MKPFLLGCLTVAAVTVQAEKLENRIDFDDANILGQSNDAGAIYLSHRKQNTIESLLSYRLHYRDEILSTFSYEGIDAKTGELLLPVPFVENAVTFDAQSNKEAK